MKAVEVELAPEAAAVGLEVRVVGNDSGEKVPAFYWPSQPQLRGALR
jgi:hypothetical protein